MKPITVYHYPRCSTCKKALRWLDEAGIPYDAHDIVTETPSSEQLLAWIQANELPLRRWFNTSGQLYRELGLKDRLDGMTDEEAAELLASNGMLIKRPLVTDGRRVTVGFNEKTFQTWKA